MRNTKINIQYWINFLGDNEHSAMASDFYKELKHFITILVTDFTKKVFQR